MIVKDKDINNYNSFITQRFKTLFIKVNVF